MGEQRLDELHDHYESRIGRVDQLVPVKARISKAPRNVFSLRIAADELDIVADAAKARGISVGDFIRQAALKEAKRPAAADEQSRLDQIYECVRDIRETVRRANKAG